MSKFSASVNSDLGNGSFGVEIGDAEHVDRCSWKYTRVWSYQLTSDLDQRCLLFWICSCGLQWSCLKAVSVPTFVFGGLRGSTATSDLVLLIQIASLEKKTIQKEKKQTNWVLHLCVLDSKIACSTCKLVHSITRVGSKFCCYSPFHSLNLIFRRSSDGNWFVWWSPLGGPENSVITWKFHSNHLLLCFCTKLTRVR